MALTLNGSNNTIAGVAVGGLPDGIVDTDMLAATAVTRAKSNLPGSILQVLQTSTTTAVTNTTTSFADTGLTGSITPSSSSNKVLITISQAYQVERNAGANGGSIQLLRGSTVLNNILANNHGLYIYAAGVSQVTLYGVYNLTYLDSPSTTSATTYKTQGVCYTTSNSGQFITQPGSAKSFMTLMEVSG